MIKQVDISKMTQKEKEETWKEANILKAMNHPNIIRFREVYKTKQGKLCIVMDFADGNSSHLFQMVISKERLRRLEADSSQKIRF